MIEEPPLLTIKRPSRRPTGAQIAAFRGMPAAVVTDAMEGAGTLAAAIGPLDPASLEVPVVGPALTAGCGPGDILALQGAMALMTSGDVLVAGFDGWQGCAVMGDRFAGMLRNQGAAGLVTDGPVRDAEGIVAAGLKVWCTGRTPASPVSNGPGTVGLPVQIGGQRVETGDMIVADRDGVVVVPFAEIDRVAARAAEILGLEAGLDARVAAGLGAPNWVRELLDSDRVRWLD